MSASCDAIGDSGPSLSESPLLSGTRQKKKKIGYGVGQIFDFGSVCGVAHVLFGVCGFGLLYFFFVRQLSG